ncbi:hypothetical protein KOW79_005396 [Hemibagrus wyckioides]|uniref:Histone-lysine N-methyltransferase PRDM9 n=1 Tax=Hemibagrus wyckioides TaxID=337641 RepID=A0A9D3P2Q2_9TELE|nr:hypothetical protein KOW79_005396 [Hemibagrus wyckioides]
MSSAGDSKPQAPDPAFSQLCEDVKKETSGRGMELRVKQEETQEPNVYQHGDDFDNIPEVISIKEEEADSEDYLYCEFCKSHFFNKCEVHGPALFIPDTPVPMGVTDRARQTLPPGLEIRKSGIPDADLGVFNKGETVSVGAHFGPYQGELVDREESKSSRYSWVISRSGQSEKYIDAKREMHANWMRYVNCARNEGEQNLVAFKYRGGILYRCCRTINPGQELLVWYKEEYAKDLGHTFDSLWNKKCSANEVNKAAFQLFSCSFCPLYYTSQIYLNEHIQSYHYEEDLKQRQSRESQMPMNSSSNQQASIALSNGPLQKEMQKKINLCSDSEGDRKPQTPDPAFSQTSDGGTSGEIEVCVKKEETLDLNIYNHGDNHRHRPEVTVKEEEADHEDYLYCEFCESHFFNKCEVHGPALFIPDTPVPMGVTDRARQTLPPGLEIRKSGIPDADLGVFNKGETVPVGAHFGPYQGVLVDREEAMNSRYSWVALDLIFDPVVEERDEAEPAEEEEEVSEKENITENDEDFVPTDEEESSAEEEPPEMFSNPKMEIFSGPPFLQATYAIYRSGQCEEYIDAKREVCANWMRYVNCARDEEEQNLVAIKYRGGILYRSCRPINSEQELLVWYNEDHAKDLSRTCDYRRNKKCSTNENNSPLQGFSCSLCSFSYTAQTDFNEHVQNFHCKEA